MENNDQLKDFIETHKEFLKVMSENDSGKLPGIFSIVFGIVGIFLLGILFSALGFFSGLYAVYKKRFILGIVGMILSIVALVTSPTFWLAYVGYRESGKHQPVSIPSKNPIDKDSKKEIVEVPAKDIAAHDSFVSLLIPAKAEGADIPKENLLKAEEILANIPLKSIEAIVKTDAGYAHLMENFQFLDKTNRNLTSHAYFVPGGTASAYYVLSKNEAESFLKSIYFDTVGSFEKLNRMNSEDYGARRREIILQFTSQMKGVESIIAKMDTDSLLESENFKFYRLTERKKLANGKMDLTKFVFGDAEYLKYLKISIFKCSDDGPYAGNYALFVQ